jgi:hypothetical protein
LSDTIEKLLEDAMDDGEFLGKGEVVKGAMYMAAKHNNRIFVGVYTADNREYVCGAEEITETQVNKYI